MANATLAEIEEIARKGGAEHMATYRSLVDLYKGSLPQNVSDEMTRDNAAFFQRCIRLMRKHGATSSERKAYARGLHAGMSEGLAAIYLNYLESA